MMQRVCVADAVSTIRTMRLSALTLGLIATGLFGALLPRGVDARLRRLSKGEKGPTDWPASTGASKWVVTSRHHHRRRTQEEWYDDDTTSNPPEPEFNGNKLMNEPKNCWEPKGDKTCTPSSSPTVSFAPSHRPSALPSTAPSTSPKPTISSQPSESPTTSRAPSASPTAVPSPSPSQRPSLVPSPSPSRWPTNYPTRSPPPSATPSERPTISPTTAFPTVSFQPTRTKRPTMSPTVDPNGYTTRISTDATGQTGVISSCRPSIPDGVDVMDQALIFDYEIQLVPGSDVLLAIDYIASQLHRVLSDEYLHCQYTDSASVPLSAASDANGTDVTNDADTSTTNPTEQPTDANKSTGPPNTTEQPFYIHALSSLPVDLVDTDNSDCSETSLTNESDCYRVDAAFLAKIFYMGGGSERRRLQDDVNVDVTDPLLLESFTTLLEYMFANGNVTSGMSSIVGASFEGITNNGQGNDDDVGTDDGTDDGVNVIDDASVPEDDTIAPRGPVGGQTNRSSSRSAPRVIASSILGVAIALALSAALIFLFMRRRRNVRSDTKVMDTTQPPGPGENSYFTDLAADPSYERDDRAMLSGDRSYIASDDGSYMSGTASSRYQHQRSRRNNDLKAAVIVEDDQSSFGPSAFPMIDPREFESKAREQDQHPSFVKTDEILDSLRQAEMRSRIKELGPRLIGDSAVISRGQRDYGVPDTVQL